jgi:hypothetical protein
MQTDSLLTDLDRARLDRWAGSLDQNKIYWHRGQQLAEIARPIVGELSRLEQENQRLQTRVDNLDCAHKLALGDGATTRDALTAARAEVQRLRGELEKDKPEATPDAGLRSRVATLEGRVQGIIEGTKARMDSMDARLASLEAGIRAPRSFTTGSGYGQSGSS